MITRSIVRPARADDVVAYARWRAGRDAVHAAYRAWAAASESGAPPAFRAYQVALDGEERAARSYARLLSRAGDAPEGRRADRSSQIDSPRGPW